MKNIRSFIVFLTLATCCLPHIFSPAFADVTLSNDPTQLSVGARVLGMGRAFAGISDDPSAIFINPAGLGKADNLQLSSMSSKYLGEFDYVQASALYPTPYGTFGIGYGGSSINFTTYSSEVVTVGGQQQVAATGEVRGTYSDSALLIAYGNKINFLKLNNLYIGGSLKYISQSLAAIGISSGTGSGTGLSLGALYPVRKDLSLGLSLQNTLVNKVVWNTNAEENLPGIMKLGLACNLLGKNGVIKHQQELQLAFDWDNYLNGQNFSVAHLGAEWSVVPTITLRAGIDASNLSAGVGLWFNDFRFDYA
ncbi:MAG: hypothetical protein QME05_04910, partial [Candidatus Margulisbacteria bacterium]|nr:hypothetical protein [Candidatus Margulisiibacteriota bacterium]